MASEQVKKSNEEMEIDLRAFFLKLKSKWQVCVIGLLVGAILGLGYAIVKINPVYQSTAMIYLRGSSSTSISISDLQLGSQLSPDYEIIFKSRPVLENVKKDIQSNDYQGNSKAIADSLSAGGLKGMISIMGTEGTRMLQITCTAGAPDIAADIANSVVENGSQAVSEIDAQQPYVVEEALPSSAIIGISKSKMTMMGALAGLLLTIGYFFLRFVLSDNITSADEAEDVLGVPVLAVVLDDPRLDYKKVMKKD